MAGFAEGFQLGESIKKSRLAQEFQARHQALQEQAAEVQRTHAALEKVKQFVDTMKIDDPALLRNGIEGIWRSFGLDPRSPNTKSVTDTLVKAQAESRRSIAQGLAGWAKDATPDEIQTMVQGVGAGRISFPEAGKKLVEDIQRRRREGTMQRVDQQAPMPTPATPDQPDMSATPQDMPQEPGRQVMEAPGAKLGDIMGMNAQGGSESLIPKGPNASLPTPGGMTLGDTLNPQPVADQPEDPFAVPDMQPQEAPMRSLQQDSGVGITQPDQQGLGPAPADTAQPSNTTGDPWVDRVVGPNVEGTAKNPNSSAAGTGQFISSTWLDMMERYRPDLTEGRGTREILAMRSDPALGREMTGHYRDENRTYLEAKGLPTDSGSLYLAHFLGPRDAAKVLASDDNSSVSRVVGSGAVAANSFLRGMDVGDLKDWAAGKMRGIDDTQTASAAPAPQPTAAPQANALDQPQMVKTTTEPGVPPASAQAAPAQQTSPQMDENKALLARIDALNKEKDAFIAAGGGDNVKHAENLASMVTTLQARVDKNKKAAGVADVVGRARDLPNEFGNDATERALGPWQATVVDAGTTSSAIGAAINFLPQQLARGIAEVKTSISGGATPTEVRDRIEAQGSRISSVMKPLIRQPGEGTWSDKDQAFLDRLTSGLSSSRSMEEYGRRIEDIRKFIGDTLGQEIKLPPVAARSANAPKTPEQDVTPFEKQDAAVVSDVKSIKEAIKGTLGEALGHIPSDKQIVETMKTLGDIFPELQKASRRAPPLIKRVGPN